MAARSRDPYEVLGVPRNVSDAELRAAYRRLVQRHHPDHNKGSVESARRFEEVQEAYAQVVKLRAAQGPSPTAEAQSDVDARIADLERQVREARAARERAERAAAEARRQAARAASGDLREQAGRPSDEDLGYVTTDDSFTKVLDDAWADLRRWLGDVRKGDKQ